MGRDSENILLSAWSHPLFTRLARPDTSVQLEPPPDEVEPVVVKVEVVVMSEEKEEEETVIGQGEAANESAAEGSVMPVIVEVYR